MKKIILFVVAILFVNNSIAQRKKYLLFGFMKVAPSQDQTYIVYSF